MDWETEEEGRREGGKRLKMMGGGVGGEDANELGGNDQSNHTTIPTTPEST